MQPDYSKDITAMSRQELLQYIEFLENNRNQVKSNYGEVHYCEVFMSSPAVWLTIDAETGRIVDANSSASSFYGYSIRELKTMTIFQINTASVEEITMRMTSVRDRHMKAIPFLHKLKSGEIREVEVYSGPVKGADQTLLSSIIIDVTAQRQAEKELKESRDRLAMVFEATEAGIWEWDQASQTIYHDGRWKAMFGYEGYVLEKSAGGWQRYCHPEDIFQIKQAAEDYLAGRKERFDVEYRARRKDGTYRWARSTGKVIFNQERQPVRWVGLNVDINDRKRIEEMQKEREMLLRDFAQAVADVGFIIDEDGRIIEVFGEDEKILLIPGQDLQGSMVFDLLPGKRASVLFEEIKQAFTAPKLRNVKHRLHSPEGERVLISRMMPLNYSVDNKRTVAVVVQDVTEQEKARRLLHISYEMRRRSDFLNDLLSGIRPVNEDAVIYLKKMGLDISLPLFCCVISIELARAAAREKIDMNGRQGIIDEVMEKLDEMPGIIVWGSRDSIGVLCQITGPDQPNQCSAVHKARLLKEQICRWNPDLTVAIGIGEVQYGINGFRKSMRQAWETTLAQHCGEDINNGIAHYRDLGILQLLVDYGGRERAVEFVAGTIGKLIDYDHDKGTDYVNTLEAILRSGNLKETANQLFLHPNTLLFRKRRIEKILGVSITEFETKLALAAAVKLHKINLSKTRSANNS
jgi:PAS domain S-box-containing protein